MAFLTELVHSDRLLSILYENLPDEIKLSSLYERVAEYFEKYLKYNAISNQAAILMYNHYISRYIKDCKYFSKTGNYPLEDGHDDFSISREEYDIFLLFSVLLTKHRFRIMQLLQQQSPGEKALFIGIGPGLELTLTKDKYAEIHAYDLSVNQFLFSQFPGVRINIELYAGQKQNYFNVIYLIEILEHLSDPFNLLDICRKSLQKGGKIVLTTATDIPQFDHLYNFPLNHAAFEEKVKKMGFSVSQKEMIPHDYLMMNQPGWKPCNHFYSLALGTS